MSDYKDKVHEHLENLAKILEDLQQRENEGRGVECVRSIVYYLRKHDFNTASAVTRNEWDKISTYLQIASVLITYGLYTTMRRISDDYEDWEDDDLETAERRSRGIRGIDYADE